MDLSNDSTELELSRFRGRIKHEGLGAESLLLTFKLFVRPGIHFETIWQLVLV